MKKKELEILVDLQEEYISDLEHDIVTIFHLVQENYNTIDTLRNECEHLRFRNSELRDILESEKSNRVGIVLILLISVIINVGQQVDQDWPLVIIDHYGRTHNIILKPGEVLFYESAKCYHGRPHPLQGDRFANIFGHTRPLNWNPQVFQNQLQTGSMILE